MYGLRMGDRYKYIKRVQLDLLNKNTAHLHEFLEISEGLAELMLLIMNRLPATAQGNEDGDPLNSTKTVLVRLFNDFEAAKVTALRGLPDQSWGVLRDSVECILLLRLFSADQTAASRWLTHANEYPPGVVYSELKKRKLRAFEYSLYGTLSDLTHPNLIGSLATVKETDHEDGRITVEWKIGGVDAPAFIRSILTHTCLLQLAAVRGALVNLLDEYLSPDERRSWRKIIEDMLEAVSILQGKKSDREPIDPGGAGAALAKIDKKTKRFEEKWLAEMRRVLGSDFSFEG